MRPMIPLKYKIFFPALVGLAGTGFLYHSLTEKGLEDDRSRLGIRLADTVGESVQFAIETWLKSRMGELERVVKSYVPGKAEELFQQTSSDFNSDILNLTFYHPQGENRFALEFATNWNLLKEEELPENTPFLANQAHPVPILELLQSHNTALINRSFETAEGETVAVQSFVLYGKGLEGAPQGSLIVADVLARKLSEKLSETKLAKTYLVSAKGALLAHPDEELLSEYLSEPFPGFPLATLPKTWKEGAHTEWNYKGKTWFVLTRPLGVHGVYLVSQVEKANLSPQLKVAHNYFLFASAAVAGVCLLLAWWIGAGIAKNIRKTASIADCLADGNFEKAPVIRSLDEFREVRGTFEAISPKIQSHYKTEFERGQMEASLATVQTLRAALANPNPVQFGNWDLITHRPNVTNAFQDFWDFHQQGNVRQVVVGRANVEGVSGAMVALLARTTLDNARKFSGLFSGEPLGLQEVLAILNTAIYSAFQGRVTLIASAFEIDTETGNFSWLNAGGPVPIRWKPEGTALGLEEKALSGQNAPLGTSATLTARPVSGVLQPGERLFVHSDTAIETKEDAARPILLQTVITQGAKPLLELKPQIMQAISGRAFEQHLVFVGVGRLPQAPSQSPAAETTAQAA